MSNFGADAIELSIVVPALDEQESIGSLVDEVGRSVMGAGVAAELIVVDDGSTDQTSRRLAELASSRPWLRAVRRARRGGQSAATYAGIAASRGRFVATLDADGQNDPADLVVMLKHLQNDEADMVQGDRSANRRDHAVRRVSSWVGRTTRRLLLGDTIRDTGCSTRVMRAQFARQIPLMYSGMHRFMPFYVRMLGGRVVEQSASHRPRVAGRAKYGVLNRMLSGLADCLAVRWMAKRYRPSATEAVSQEEASCSHDTPG